MKGFKKIVCGVLLSLGTTLSCWALTIEQARIEGRVGETLQGYLVARQTDAETVALVQQINIVRKQKYKEIAQRNGVDLKEIERMMGQKIIDKAKPGEWVQGLNQQWLQK